jgi:hypothetical protein
MEKTEDLRTIQGLLVDCLQVKKHKQDSREVNLYAAEK